MTDFSIVEYFAEHEGSRCGYCKSKNTNFCHAMWAHSMSVEIYEDLIYRGWRRCGKYLYKPTNHLTCCPQYTISCDALDFVPSKSQKKILKRFNAYLRTGNLTGSSENETGEEMEEQSFMPNEMLPNTNAMRKATESDICNPKLTIQDTDEAVIPILRSQDSSIAEANVDKSKAKEKPFKNVPSEEIQLNKRKKSKQLRLEKRNERLKSKGLDPAKVPSKNTPKIKQLEDFLKPEERSVKKVNRKLVKVGSAEYISTFKNVFNLYKKYQMIVHGDDEQECSEKQFTRFLCDPPFHSELAEEGAFHQHYYLDKTLIAVGVIDILPHCLSSVYFFYDPDYRKLSLGTYGALREIEYVRARNEVYPQFSKYLMGFYIHSCQKMRYKGNYFPSCLLCPESYTWHLLDDKVRKRLDETKYIVLNLSPKNLPDNVNIFLTQILFGSTIMRYNSYVVRRKVNDDPEIQQYCNLVGAKVVSKLILFRSNSS